MGLYDQLLGLTQRGLDAGTDIAMQRAAQPTMADVFMDRYRQGGQDIMARQKMEEEARVREEAIKNTQAQRLLSGVQTGLVYGTPDNEAFLKANLAKIPGMDVGALDFSGTKQREMEARESALKMKLDAELQKVKDKAAADAAAGKNLSTWGKVQREANMGLLSPDMSGKAFTKLNTVFDPVRTALAAQGLRPETGGGIPAKVTPIEGGKADVERSGKIAEAKAAFGAASRDVEDLVTKIDQVLASPGLDKAVGITGKVMRQVPASDAAVAAGLLASIKAQAGLQKIADLKKSGAGLGQVTEGEHTLVQNAANSLDLDTMDAKTLRSNLKELRRKAVRLGNALQSDMQGKAQALGDQPKSGSRIGQATSMPDGSYSDGKTTVTVKGGKIVSEQ